MDDITKQLIRNIERARAERDRLERAAVEAQQAYNTARRALGARMAWAAGYAVGDLLEFRSGRSTMVGRVVWFDCSGYLSDDPGFVPYVKRVSRADGSELHFQPDRMYSDYRRVALQDGKWVPVDRRIGSPMVDDDGRVVAEEIPEPVPGVFAGESAESDRADAESDPHNAK